MKVIKVDKIEQELCDIITWLMNSEDSPDSCCGWHTVMTARSRLYKWAKKMNRGKHGKER